MLLEQASPRIFLFLTVLLQELVLYALLRVCEHAISGLIDGFLSAPLKYSSPTSFVQFLEVLSPLLWYCGRAVAMGA